MAPGTVSAASAGSTTRRMRRSPSDVVVVGPLAPPARTPRSSWVPCSPWAPASRVERSDASPSVTPTPRPRSTSPSRGRPAAGHDHQARPGPRRAGDVGRRPAATSAERHGQSTTRRLATTWVTAGDPPCAGGRALPAEHEPGGQVERQHPDPVGAHVHDREQHRRADQGPDGAGRQQQSVAEAPEEGLLGHGGERAGEDEGQAGRHGRVAAADQARPMAKAATPTPTTARFDGCRRAGAAAPSRVGRRAASHAPATSSATNSPTSTAAGWVVAATSAGRAPSSDAATTTTSTDGRPGRPERGARLGGRPPSAAAGGRRRPRAARSRRSPDLEHHGRHHPVGEGSVIGRDELGLDGVRALARGRAGPG